MKPLRRHRPAPKQRSAQTALVHAGAPTHELSGTVLPPVYRFTTVTYDSVADYMKAHDDRFGQLIYGRLGSPTTWGLEDALCELEGGTDCVLTPSGLAAIYVALTATLSAGDHVLITDTVYPPVRLFSESTLKRFGIEVEYYDPLIGKGIAKLIRPNTRVVYVESPGSQTFEVQDIPAIARAAHAAGALVICDNSWATGLYCRSFDLGVDICVLACTKYIVGHSDAMVGAVVSKDAKLGERVRKHWFETGTAIAPDDAFLALRGMRTLSVRLERHRSNALKVAKWLEQRADVERVLFPALPSHPQHRIWKRDFRGASGLFSFVPKKASEKQVRAFVDSLALFGIGASWGGYESLAMPSLPLRTAASRPWSGERSAIRLHIGLENVDELIADLEQGFRVMRSRV
jgi:cystathionine beta-lyase